MTRHGPIEYTTWGEGPAVLGIHGAGGGYDQGVSIARAFGGDGFRWISPSRFGYLSTPIPADASTAAQADAFADLLDALNIKQVAIFAFSSGVPPALQFAWRYPERTSALALLSGAPYTPLTARRHEHEHIVDRQVEQRRRSPFADPLAPGRQQQHRHAQQGHPKPAVDMRPKNGSGPGLVIATDSAAF